MIAPVQPSEGDMETAKLVLNTIWAKDGFGCGIIALALAKRAADSAASEREACAKIADAYVDDLIAAAIRSRK